ncbi:MAG: 16S rRNA (cytidine(1402)-2'-O)-methyltransferase [Bacteroidetes bacterium]|nr:16S rRNA (cytidine(1402)-2'-O)-methyltransferase [Bacteroidota bacterium]
MAARVVLVPTPIGNLQDITLRALEVLRTADRIAAEDTRHSRRLLDAHEIRTPVISLHQHNEHRVLPTLLAQVAAGEWTLAVVSDAGTPGVSDPGFLIVREALAAGILVEVLPGPVAFVPALVGSGLPCDRFCFEGFLPQKKGRQTRLLALAQEPRTMVFYEAPHRLLKTLDNFSATFGPQRQAAVCRELTKVHEDIRRGTLAELQAHYTAHPPKGECVVVVAGHE